MLAGVSHDLRTVLTRFRLQLAMMGGAQIPDLKRDVDEMQQMLEDYLAFAKGDAGEKARRIGILGLLEEVQAEFEAPGRTVRLEVRQHPLVVSLRRNGFKRAIVNLVSNAARYADTISIRALKSRGWIRPAIRIRKAPGLALPLPATSSGDMAARSRLPAACWAV
jgi:two-component system osmolarity sensor histidine kinase EnvZ